MPCEFEMTMRVEESAFFTIGYGVRSVEELLAALRARRIEWLIDVRTKPYSKFRPEFGKEALERALKQEGLRYVYMGDTLGGMPDDPACYTDGKVAYAIVRQQQFFRDGMARLENARKKGLRVVLMCSEARPEQCHRSKLIGEELEKAGIPVWHIDENGEDRTQKEVVHRLTDGQASLFSEEDLPASFTSRKRYTGANDERDERDE